MDGRKYVIAEVLASFVRGGSHIHLSSIAGAPHILIDDLKKRAGAVEVND